MTSGFVSIPERDAYRLRNAKIPRCLLEGEAACLAPGRDDLVDADIAVLGGRIAAIEPVKPGGGEGIDLDGGQVWPCFVDLHTHLDKAHMWPRASNPDGTHTGALTSVAKDRSANWSADDVGRRIDFALRCAYAHGTAAIRTHVDSRPPQNRISWPVVSELRDRWAGRMEIQAVSLMHFSDFADPATAQEVADTVAAHGGLLGAVAGAEDGLDEVFDIMFRAAAERGLDLDFHVDETNDPEAHALDRVAEAKMRNRFEGRVTVGHCCSLAIRPDGEVDRALDLVVEAGLHVVSLPMCNMYLQDRDVGRTPRWRGVTLLHEMRARGIPVSVASDNTRDPFYAYGDLDGLEVFTQAVRIAQLEYPLDPWPAAVTRTPADTMGLDRCGRIGVGLSADLVLFHARGYSELLVRPQADRVVLRAGKPIDTQLPDFRELDDLLAASA